MATNQAQAASTIDGNGHLSLSTNGMIAILMATSLALLATPLVAPAMKDLAVAYAGREEQEALARGILWLISWLPGKADINFLVKFVLLSIPALFIVLAAPIAGWLADNWGRRPLLIASLVLFTLSGVSGFFVSTFTGLFIGRAFLGLSVAGIKTATITMAGDFFKGEERARFLGFQGSAMKAGGVVFMLLGGYLASVHWSLPFWAYLLALLALPGAIWSLAESKPQRVVDRPVNAGASIPMLQVSYAFTGAFLASVLFYLSVVQMNFFLFDAFQLSNFYTGLTVAIGNTVSAIIAFKYVFVKARLSYVTTFALIFLFMSVGYFVVSIAPSYIVVLLGISCAGLGFGLIVPNQSAWIIEVVPPERRGFGVGLITTAMFLGQFAAPILIQPIMDPDDPFQVFRTASIVLMVLAILYGIAGWFLAKRSVDSLST